MTEVVTVTAKKRMLMLIGAALEIFPPDNKNKLFGSTNLKK
jgi:hypothetical protein